MFTLTVCLLLQPPNCKAKFGFEKNWWQGPQEFWQFGESHFYTSTHLCRMSQIALCARQSLFCSCWSTITQSRVMSYLKWLPSLPGIVTEINITEAGVVTMTTRIATRMTGNKTETRLSIGTERGKRAAGKTRLEFFKNS